MKKVPGKVVSEKGKFFVQVGDTKHVLQPGPLGGEESLKSLGGHRVEVVLSEPTAIAILVTKPQVGPHPCFVC